MHGYWHSTYVENSSQAGDMALALSTAVDNYDTARLKMPGSLCSHFVTTKKLILLKFFSVSKLTVLQGFNITCGCTSLPHMLMNL